MPREEVPNGSLRNYSSNEQQYKKPLTVRKKSKHSDKSVHGNHNNVNSKNPSVEREAHSYDVKERRLNKLNSRIADYSSKVVRFDVGIGTRSCKGIG